MFFVYRIVRRFRSLLRRWFGGDPPAWAIDLYKAVKVVNFVELLPTIAAIALAPRHFFHRLNLVLEKRPSGIRKSSYKTPIQLVASIVALILASKWLALLVAPARIKLLLVLILIAMPFLVPLFGIILWLLMVLCLMLTAVGTGFGSVLAPRVDRFHFYMRVLIDPSTYKALNWRRVGWSALYFYGYLISFPIFFALALGTVVYVGLDHLILYFNHELPPPLVAGLAAAAILFCCLAIGRIVVFPYTAALMESMDRLTSLVLYLEFRQFFDAIRKMELYCKYLRGEQISDSQRSTALRACADFGPAWEKTKASWPAFAVRHSIPPQEREASRAYLLANPITDLMQDVRTSNLSKEEVLALAKIWIESLPAAKQETAQSTVSSWFQSESSWDGNLEITQQRTR